MFRITIIGSRTFSDYELLEKTIERYYGIHYMKLKDEWINNNKTPTFPTKEYFTYNFEIISGGASGADSVARQFALNYGCKLTEFLPDWNKHGKAAGPIRNEDIVKNANEVLCFWDGLSKGSQNSISIAKRLKKNTIIIYF